MTLKVILANIDKFTMYRVPKVVADELHDIGEEIKKKAKENVDRAPPDHPQVRTGKLQKSFKFRVRKTKWRQTLRVYTKVEYASYLEHGFIHSSGRRVGPYPFLGPAFKEVTKKKRKWRI